MTSSSSSSSSEGMSSIDSERGGDSAASTCSMSEGADCARGFVCALSPGDVGSGKRDAVGLAIASARARGGGEGETLPKTFWGTSCFGFSGVAQTSVCPSAAAPHRLAGRLRLLGAVSYTHLTLPTNREE